MELQEKLSDITCKNVLLVDDEEIDLFIHEKVLTTTGFASQVHKVQSGRLALEYLKAAKTQEDLPELIFLDLNMPLMNGFDFLTAFERLPKNITEHCKVVILTSSSSDGDRSKAMKYNAVMKYIYKPINEVLLTELKKISDIKRATGDPIATIMDNFKKQHQRGSRTN